MAWITWLVLQVVALIPLSDPGVHGARTCSVLQTNGKTAEGASLYELEEQTRRLEAAARLQQTHAANTEGLPYTLARAEEAEAVLRVFTAEAEAQKIKMARGSAGFNNSQPAPGIGFLGRGYDLYSGDLLVPDTDNYGFRLPVIELSYLKGKHTADGRFLVPDSADILPATPGASVSETPAWVLRGTADYLRMVGEFIQTPGQDWLDDGRFAASATYRRIRKVTQTGNIAVIALGEFHAAYSATLEGSKLTLTKGIVEALRSLPTSCVSDDGSLSGEYVTFILTYGSHYVKQVTIGTRYVRMDSSHTEWISYQQRHGYSLQEIVTGNSIGGSKSASSKTDPMYKDNTVQDAPLKLTLETIDGLLKTITAVEVKGITKKVKCLKAAIMAYCVGKTGQTCSPRPSFETSSAIRYGDRISLSMEGGGRLSLNPDRLLFGRHTGLPIELGQLRSDEKIAKLHIMPSSNELTRLGSFLHSGDFFQLDSSEGIVSVTKVGARERWLSQLSWRSHQERVVIFEDEALLNGQKGSESDDWAIFVPDLKRLPFVMTIDVADTINGSSADVTSLGPFSLTIQGRDASTTLLIDPCRNQCYPGRRKVAALYLPPGVDPIQRLDMSILPSWMQEGSRPGRLSISRIVIENLSSSLRYVTTGTILSSASSCQQCASFQAAVSDNSLTQSTGPVKSEGDMRDAWFSINAIPVDNRTATASGPFIDGDKVTLRIPEIAPTIVLAHAFRCVPESCAHGGTCGEGDRQGSCHCSALWTGPTCESPCSTDLITPADIFGSPGSIRHGGLLWGFPAQEPNTPVSRHFVILFSGLMKVSAIQLPQENSWVDFSLEFYNVTDMSWRNNVNLSGIPNHRAAYFLSLGISDALVTTKLRLNYKKSQNNVSLIGLRVYGCDEQLRPLYNNYYLSSLQPFTLTLVKDPSRPKGKNLETIIKRAMDATENDPVIVTETLAFTVITEPNITCNTNYSDVKWVVGRQIDLCPSSITIVDISTTTDLQERLSIRVELRMTGEDHVIVAAKTEALQKVKAGNMTLACNGPVLKEAVFVDMGGFGDKVHFLEQKIIILAAVLIVLLLLCLIIFIVYLAIMSRRFRDINNELTTLRKMKAQKRITKRQEVQTRQLPVTSPLGPQRRTSPVSSIASSVPRNGHQGGRPLRYSQSLHGYIDRPARHMDSHIAGHAALDPANYIIPNPYRAPSPQGTRSGEESDTVQSTC